LCSDIPDWVTFLAFTLFFGDYERWKEHEADFRVRASPE
jgi:hypothetical protein